jgi:hypothetical protein
VARAAALAEKVLAFPLVSFRGCEVNAHKAQRQDDGENGEKYFLTHNYVPSFLVDSFSAPFNRCGSYAMAKRMPFLVIDKYVFITTT